MPDSPAVGFGFLNERLRDAVQAFIDAGHDPNDPAAGFYISDDLALRYAHVADASEFEERLSETARRLGLDALETAVLALCAAPELDPRYGKVFSFLHDDVTRKLPSPRLVSDLLAVDGVDRGAVVGCFAATGRLRRLGCIELVETDGPRPFLDRAIRLAEPLTAFLLGTRLHERLSDGRLRAIDLPAHDLGRAETVERLRSLLGQPGELPILVAGSDAVPLLAAALGMPLLLADVRHLGDPGVHAYAALLGALEGRQLAFDGLDDLDPAGRARCAEELERSTEQVLLCARSAEAVVALGDVATIVVEVPDPALADRRRAWTELSGSEASEEVAQKFRLSITQIARAAEIAKAEAGARERAQPGAEDLEHGARQASSSRLGELAARLAPSYGWDDLVLPDRELELLRSISAYLRHRDRVLSEWGYERTSRSQGLKVLFAGESGTGKTMAAQVLANELGLELFRVDLATIVSKYIGETEKNLDRIFDAAEGSNAILFFDEADALFGKRSEVSDSHDRYANIEVAYLLQKMEGYVGAVILATNFRQNIDDAFARRLDFAIDFPFPEAQDRKRIWRLVLPEEAPLADDIDVDFLAEQFKLSGGSIRNCSLAAAFEAAEADEPIGMEQLVRAVALEYGKHGRLTIEADFERFHPLVRRERPAEEPPARPAPPEPEPAPPVPAPGSFERLVVRGKIEEMGDR